MAKGAGQREKVARALLLFSATLISFVDAVILYIYVTPSLVSDIRADWILISMYLIGVGGIVAYFIISWKREKDGNLLAFAIAASLIVFVLPAFAQASIAG